ncbi:MAG: hypothetical protein AMJ64_12865 [Betaproteobacteria bacterium SG8_39]|nr:MAG: hypothetical protein AMJ64_12865 [Betaproteobacteria bacterium SG8_39]
MQATKNPSWRLHARSVHNRADAGHRPRPGFVRPARRGRRSRLRRRIRRHDTAVRKPYRSSRYAGRPPHRKRDRTTCGTADERAAAARRAGPPCGDHGMRRAEATGQPNESLGLECAWPGISGPRQARTGRRPVHRARLVTFVLWILTGLGYGGGVSERGQ